MAWLLATTNANAQQISDSVKVTLAESSSVSFGGEFRLTDTQVRNLAFGLQSKADTTFHEFAQRALLHADWHDAQGLRAFLQLGAHTVPGEALSSPPTQQNALDVAQAFVQRTMSASDGREISVRLGRQEMTFGSSRMITPRDGASTRLTFDAARATIHGSDGSTFDVFVARPVIPKKGAFDDSSHNASPFMGAYATWLFAPSSGVDWYLLSLRKQKGVVLGLSGEETRRTLGTRLFGRAESWDWDLEAALQTGTLAGRRVRAYTFANDVGYTATNLPWRPRVGLKVDLASGDNRSGDGTIGTFEVPFPKLPYLTETGALWPANLVDVHPSLTLQPTPHLKFVLEAARVWKHSVADAAYVPPGIPLTGTTNGSRDLGRAAQFAVVWQPTPHLLARLSVARFNPGVVFRNTGAKSIEYGLFSVSQRF
jgi:Alginate export